MKLREFAASVVTRLQQAGFEALWAGGCVRDQVMGLEPKDYDVATSATPDQVRQLFGYRKTLPIGAAFGVVAVIGPRGLGQIEVATFRTDSKYSDGRHPDSVKFTNAQEDARRRDFTINGMFYNPVTDQIIDYVGGRQDIRARCVRAIGDPKQRISEDKLRMLRGIRFAATFDFQLETATRQAIADSAAEIQEISAERIGGEVTRILAHGNRSQGAELLFETGLLQQIVPDVLRPQFSELICERQEILARLARLTSDRFEPAMYLLFQPFFASLEVVEERFPSAKLDKIGVPNENSIEIDESFFESIESERARMSVQAKQIHQICRHFQNQWKLTNQQRDDLAWIANNWRVLADAEETPWALLQPLLLHPACQLGLAVVEASDSFSQGLQYCRTCLAWSRDKLDPPAILTGEDLIRLGLKPDSRFKMLIQGARDRQLHGRFKTLAEAEAWALENYRRC